MTRTEIIELFRAENPKITDRVVTDTVLNNWCKVGDKDICAETRCIVGSTVFNSLVSTSSYSTLYDLTAEISKFYDIDDNPGGGVSFDDEPLEKTTISELDQQHKSWRTYSAGTPEKYYRWGEWLGFDRPIKTADKEIRVYSVLISDPFDADDKTPYNQLTYLEPFHYGIVKYLQWRAEGKVSKKEDAELARVEYFAYTARMKKMIGGGKFGNIYFQPRG